MNSTRTTFQIHSWLGLITSVFLLVISLTGAYLVFDVELDRFLNPEIRTRPVTVQPVSVDKVLNAVRSAYPHHHIGLLTFPTDDRSPFVASLRNIDGDGDFVRDQVYVDAGSGQIIGHRVSSHYLTSWILRLHEGLWLPERWGQPLVAILGIAMTLLGLTGLWVYRKKIWEALTWKRSMQRLGRTHSHFGIWGLIFAVLLGITGAVLNFSSLLIVCRAPAVPQMGSEWPILDHLPTMESLLEATRNSFPDLELHGIYFPSKVKDPIRVGGYAPQWEILGKSSYVAFEVVSMPKVASIFDARKAALPIKLLLMTNSLHYGDFAGSISKTIYVIGGLVMTFLAGSGLWLWIRPRRAA